MLFVFFCKQKTAYELRISDWSSDVCSSDLSFLLDDQRMIASRCKRRWQPLEHPRAIMADRAGLAVHQLRRAHHAPAECLADRLMAKTDAEQWALFRCAGRQQNKRDASFIGRDRNSVV